MFLICILLTYALFHSLAEWGEPYALTALAYLGLFLLATVLISVRQKRFPLRALPVGILCLASALGFVLHDDPDLHVVQFLLLIPLSGFYCIALTGANRYPFGSFYVLLDLLHCELLTPLRHLFAPFTDAFEALQRRHAERNPQKKRRVWLPVAIGLLAAIPVILIVVPLLIDADAAFESVAGGLYRAVLDAIRACGAWLSRVLPFDGFALVLSLLFTPYIYATMYAFASGKAKAENADTIVRYGRLQKLSPVFITTVLGVLCGVYAIYLLTQTGYLFSAFSGHLPFGGSMSVTEYARRGFFELCKLAGINFVLLALSVGVTRRKNGRIAPAVKGLDLFLCLFTMLLCAVSIAKILLYIRVFGLTEKRVYVFAADVVLLLSFAAIFLRFCKERFPYMQIIIGAVCIAVTSLSLLGVNHTIARVNTEGLLSGRLQKMTAEDICDTAGDAALPYLQRIAESQNDQAPQAKRILDDMAAYQLERMQEPFRNLEQEKVVRYLHERNEQANVFTVEIALETEKTIYGLGYGYYLNEKLVSSGGVINADETPLKDRVTLEVDRRDLPKDTDLSGFRLSLSVYLSPGDDAKETEAPLGSEWVLSDVAWGGVYQLTLCDNEDNGFEVWD